MSLFGPRLVVYERSDPLVTIRFRKKQPSPPGSVIAYSLTGAPTISFLAKVNPNDTDGSAVITYSTSTGQIVITQDGSVGQYSEITIQFANTDLPNPRTLYYFITVVKASKKDVIANNYLEIRNI